MTTGIRLAIRSSVERRRAAGAAAAQTRPGAAIAVRVDVRARRAVHDAGWRKMVVRLGVVAKLGFKAHPHMFRHACGFQLANQGTGARTLPAEGAYFARHLEEARRLGRIGHVAVDPISGSCTLVVGQREVENPPLRGLCAPSGRDARLAEQALARSKLSSQVSADLHQLRREWQTMLAPN